MGDEEGPQGGEEPACGVGQESGSRVGGVLMSLKRLYCYVPSSNGGEFDLNLLLVQKLQNAVIEYDS